MVAVPDAFLGRRVFQRGFQGGFHPGDSSLLVNLTGNVGVYDRADIGFRLNGSRDPPYSVGSVQGFPDGAQIGYLFLIPECLPGEKMPKSS